MTTSHEYKELKNSLRAAFEGAALGLGIGLVITASISGNPQTMCHAAVAFAVAYLVNNTP